MKGGLTIPASITSNAASLLSKITHRSEQRQFELVYLPHDRWPLPRRPSESSANHRPLRISVLDSSFNPPTRAHLALAAAPAVATECSGDAYDARLLLLSVRNVDKALKRGDATHLERLEMMYILAHDLHNSPHTINKTRAESADVGHTAEVAIAITDEPTFVGKSTTLLSFFRSRLMELGDPQRVPRLTFLLGLDTLERLFSPRYYPSEEVMLQCLRHFFEAESEGSSVVCARRDPGSYPSSGLSGDQSDLIPLQAKEFIRSGQITMIDIGAEEQAFSSSQVRNERNGQGSDAWDKFLTPAIAEYIRERNLYVDQG
ncbi:Nucleotidylyl transferase [Athelia psychrophila]|uniref:Nucleotidylyl transferase n=1 Tax=Athelia psychrophila TaxID=1759441 RepID=A0A166UKL7_9AGAM|nr:Nucleotidylyl transferase [Fibularhizoctonia sp. CBS 109695]